MDLVEAGPEQPTGVDFDRPTRCNYTVELHILRILGFEWDVRNLGKVRRHDLDAEDIEELFAEGDPLVFPHPSTRGRYIALGFVPDGRFVLVVLEYDAVTRWVRVVTAYEPTHEGWWKRYEKTKRKKKGH